MNKYLVRVWIDDIEVFAENEEDAANKALELVDDGEVRIRSDYAEVQSQIL